MVKVGIDTLAIYTARYALDLAVLAEARGIDPEKFHTGLGQYVMSVPPPGEDIVTMAANAGKQAIKDINAEDIEMLLFATESGIDQSKAAGIYVHDLLGLSPHCRVIELKQACYAGTAGLQLALPFLRENPNKKVLLIASDIARYGLNTTGESSQGCGAVAMVLSTQPRIMAIEPEYGVVTENVMDFWRPNYSHEALVDGKYSSKLYLTMLEKSFKHYQASSGRQFSDHAYFCYHTPVPRLVEKAHQHLLKLNNQLDLADDIKQKHIHASLEYGRQLGNSYTAALYIGLASLLDLVEDDLTGKRIGFYSYGSGCVAEYFSGVIQPGYQAQLNTAFHSELLSSRKKLSYEEYASFYTYQYPEDGSDQDVPAYKTGEFRLTKFQQHKRIYEKVAEANTFNIVSNKTSEQDDNCLLKVYTPGKLILSGEHAIVYGQPALAMAINRYTTATITRAQAEQISLELADLEHHSHLSFSALLALKEKIKEKYHRFIRGEYSIRDVLQKPFELAHIALGIIADSLNLSLPHGVKIHVQSDIPMGCGMGSSAATILSVMHAVSNYLKMPLSPEQLYQLALEAEHMQHGKSSGMDLRIAMQGGCIYMQGQQFESRAVPNMPMFLVNTGSPQTTTGQCVEKVAPFFNSIQLREDFAAVTKAMDEALRQQSWSKMAEAVRSNHQLLTSIGVVPEKVKQFITEIETVGGAAKVCGSGAVAGDQAGAVLVMVEESKIVTSLCDQFGYNIIPIAGAARGMHAA